jgi:hypothetical protein
MWRTFSFGSCYLVEQFFLITAAGVLPRQMGLHWWEQKNLLKFHKASAGYSFREPEITEREMLHSINRNIKRADAQTFMFCESVSSIAMRSIPEPQPPVGGKPYSSAVQNASSRAIASSSPNCRFWEFHRMAGRFSENVTVEM